MGFWGDAGVEGSARERLEGPRRGSGDRGDRPVWAEDAAGQSADAECGGQHLGFATGGRPHGHCLPGDLPDEYALFGRWKKSIYITGKIEK